MIKVTKKTTGTRIRYWPDRQTFLKDAAGSLNPGVSKAFVFRRRIN